MAQFKAFSASVEANGAAILAVVEGMGAFRSTALQILKNHGIINPKKGEWFAQQNWLDAFREISDKIGHATLRSIGQKIPETAIWPPSIQTIEQALASIDEAYKMNHRNGPIGHYHFEMVGRKKGRVICDNPYPCFFDMGIIEATLKKFSNPNDFPFIRHDDSAPCRSNGGSSCTYLIQW